jgi:hypothetical protein
VAKTTPEYGAEPLVINCTGAMLTIAAAYKPLYYENGETEVQIQIMRFLVEAPPIKVEWEECREVGKGEGTF